MPPSNNAPDSPEWDLLLTPARPARDRREDAPRALGQKLGGGTDGSAERELLDLERGRTAALIASLGRLQLAVDVLCREQKVANGKVQESIRRIEERIEGLTR